MAPVTRRRKASETGDVEDKPPPPKQRRVQTKGQLQKRDRNATDEGRAASKEFFQGARKTRHTVDSAKDQIAKQVEQLRHLIDTEKQTRYEDTPGASLRQQLPEEYVSMLDRTDSSAMNIVEKASQSLKNLQRDVEHHKSLVTKDIDIQKPQWMRWSQDQRELNELNQHAVATAARTVNAMVLPRMAGSEIMVPSGGPDSVQRLAWEMFADVRPTRMEDTWGMMAQTQVRAFANMLGSSK